MPKIKLLDSSVSQLIAAGEVVERPASVVKELLENAIDSGATAITVEINGGGVSYMRISDNGCGISPEDVKTAFLRHATSKISGAGDLDSIATLGFRGEALASVASVAKVELLTRTAGSDFGTLYVIEGGREAEFSESGCQQGTTIIVRDLFYNTPARMKFLKKDVTEGGNVAFAVEKLALSRPDISFKFIRDGQLKLQTPGDGKLFSAVYAVFGKAFADTLLPIEGEKGNVRISGFISKPFFAKSSRSFENFFVNSRFVRTRTCMAAVEEACKGSIMFGRFPACVLNIQLPPAEVDVNVHPAKTEVRFRDEKSVFDAVYYGVKSALTSDKQDMSFGQNQTFGLNQAFGQNRSSSWSKPAFEVDTGKTASQIEIIDIISKAAPEKPKENLRPQGVYTMADNEAAYAEKPTASLKVTVYEQEPAPIPEQTDPPQTRPPEPRAKEFLIAGQIFDTYILAESGDDCYIIDKHAAHERLIYESLLSDIELGNRQMLLSPVLVTLDGRQCGIVLDNADTLGKYGFLAEDFGGSAVMVREVPQWISPGEIEGCVIELADALLMNKGELLSGRLLEILHSVACRSAIKAGHKTSDTELVKLVEDMLTNNVRSCPHGRPVYAILSKSEIEKRFKRI